MPPRDYKYSEGPEFLETPVSGGAVAQHVVRFARFLDDLLDNPPSDMLGTYLDEARMAWDDTRERIDSVCDDLVQASTEQLAKIGMFGRAAMAKFRQLRDAIADFYSVRTPFRAARALHVGIYVLSSIAGLVGAAEGVKEVGELVKYIADLAVE